MKQIVNRFIKKHALLLEGITVVVGVSGGPDSLALLHFLMEKQKLSNLKIIAAHVDHLLRGEESEQDYLFVEQFCRDKKIIFEGAKVNVGKYQEDHKVSLQVAARECRYRFFEEVMIKYKATFLALAHHGDDQIETILMRQIRGAYGFGLAGIRVKRPFENGEIIRPFLCVSKEEIIDYCLKEGLKPRIDQSNFTAKYLRNRIRNQLLPILKKENPSVHLKFQQQSELMLEDEHLLQSLAAKELERIVIKKSNNEIVLSISQFNNSPIALQRRCFQLILNYLPSKKIPGISTIHIDTFLSFLENSHPSGFLSFPEGLVIKKSYDQCTLVFKEINRPEHFLVYLPLPGMVSVKAGKIIGEITELPPSVKLNKSVIICDLEKLTLPLMVRSREKGDRLEIKGMQGLKQLKRLFIDEKIDREQRDRWPVVVDGNNSIIWVPQLRRSTLACPTKETQKFLVLYYENQE
ncbi:tRNA lysidine(34) synthetase TilS [Bacillaceae bacterium IKA-2]|nr:tRNA lysidine(34) synthetase TilS [Bacillaceae bacterium IKA-2]